MIGTVVQPELVLTWREIGIFLLANAIVIYFCYERFWVDFKKWIK